MKNDWMNLNQRDLRRYTGSMSQIAGLRKCVLSEGRSSGVSAVEVRTGSGLGYTVLPDRGMDIAWMEYRGMPVSYLSCTGVTAPSLYDARGMEWLRGFYGGMLTTCGLSNVGGPCREEHPVLGPRDFGLHGRIANAPAAEVFTREAWTDGTYEMCVGGKMTEAIVHGEKLSLRREIRSVLGESDLWIHDEIENEGNAPQPMMLLYHMNVGYPVLREGARLAITKSATVGASETAQAEIGLWNRSHAPVRGQAERCYFHTPRAGTDGWAVAMAINDEMEIGLRIRYRPEQLPCLTQWKMLSEGEYVLGIEPGNALPIGREEARRRGTLQILNPDQILCTDLRIDIVDGADALGLAEREIAEINEAMANRKD